MLYSKRRWTGKLLSWVQLSLYSTGRYYTAVGGELANIYLRSTDSIQPKEMLYNKRRRTGKLLSWVQLSLYSTGRYYTAVKGELANSCHGFSWVYTAEGDAIQQKEVNWQIPLMGSAESIQHTKRTSFVALAQSILLKDILYIDHFSKVYAAAWNIYTGLWRHFVLSRTILVNSNCSIFFVSALNLSLYLKHYR